MYFVFLDEFGHDGPYLNKSDRQYNQSPVFGFGGIILEAGRSFDLSNSMSSIKRSFFKTSAEIKGSKAFQGDALRPGKDNYFLRNRTLNVGYSLLEAIEKVDGQICYFGVEKTRLPPREHNSKQLHLAGMRKAFQRVNKRCFSEGSRFVLIFDEHPLHKDKLRYIKSVQNGQPTKVRILDTPYDLNSRHYECIQAADWICTLLGRIWATRVSPAEWKSQQTYEQKFGKRMSNIEFNGNQMSLRQKDMLK